MTLEIGDKVLERWTSQEGVITRTSIDLDGDPYKVEVEFIGRWKKYKKWLYYKEIVLILSSKVKE